MLNYFKEIFRIQNKGYNLLYSTFKVTLENSAELESYKVLGLRSGADQEEVRKAFLALCKQYHPDSSGSQADANKFHEIEKAYRQLQAKFIKERWDTPDDTSHSNEVAEFDIKHTAPQHRTYLSHEGVGSGTPSQRQQQYQQHRAQQAAVAVSEHRLQQLNHTHENALTLADKKRVDKAKIRSGMDRLIEDLIQESMARGDFDNLKGAGRPLPNQSYNPHVDFITHKMNEILIDNGFTPEWITLAREIRDDTQQIKKTLSEKLHFLDNELKWRQVREEIEKSVSALNKKIQLFNLIVPILNRQMMLFQLDEEIEKQRSIYNSNIKNNMFKDDAAACNQTQQKSPENVIDFFSSFFTKYS